MRRAKESTSTDGDSLVRIDRMAVDVGKFLTCGMSLSKALIKKLEAAAQTCLTSCKGVMGTLIRQAIGPAFAIVLTVEKKKEMASATPAAGGKQ